MRHLKSAAKQVSLFLLAGTFAILFSCSRTTVRFDYLRPSPVSLPPAVQKVVVVDHSAPKDSRWDVLEGGLTGEGIGQDVEGVLNFIEGFKEIGRQSHRYELVKESKRFGKGKLLENIPEPMDISLIKNLAKKHNADALLAIDKFDSDFIVTDVKMEEKKDPEDSTKTIRSYSVQGISTITVYVRVYEAVTGDILDELKIKETGEFGANGNSATDALRQLISKQVAVNQVSFQAGLHYGRRIAPTRARATRKLFTKPKGNVFFDQGVRQAEVDDWFGAIKSFTTAAKAPDQKIRGRACYNLAICNEILGKLEVARDWAQKAYVKHGLNEARQYQSTLQQRILQKSILQGQMQEENPQPINN